MRSMCSLNSLASSCWWPLGSVWRQEVRGHRQRIGRRHRNFKSSIKGDDEKPEEKTARREEVGITLPELPSWADSIRLRKITRKTKSPGRSVQSFRGFLNEAASIPIGRRY